MNADKPMGPENAPGRPSPLERLAEAVRADAAGAVDADAQREAVAAFVAARDAGAHRARTRRRDDWRPRERRPARFSLRAAGGVVLAGGLLGGVSLAAVGTVIDDPAPRERPRPAPSSPRAPGGPGTASGHTMSSPPEAGPGGEQDTRKPPKPPEKPKKSQKPKPPGQDRPKPPGQDRPKKHQKPPNKPPHPQHPEHPQHPKHPKHSENQGGHKNKAQPRGKGAEAAGSEDGSGGRAKGHR
ncbi:hypothetical protein [Streptomyces sp. KN37]|uniref:hypothetical protein n=1 Tax=Streptomyces sp. KN37 TaxID=3090667 RepID=UPI002A752FD2|nr:hypothetical protein [Streptomyces sp. KN37]WPO71873.1 hypothetical protein R9806_15175 [Streptomyces sp. KN37]